MWRRRSTLSSLQWFLEELLPPQAPQQEFLLRRELVRSNPHLWMAVSGHSMDKGQTCPRNRNATMQSATYPFPPCGMTAVYTYFLQVFQIYFLDLFASQHKRRMLGRSSPFGIAFHIKQEGTTSSTKGMYILFIKISEPEHTLQAVSSASCGGLFGRTVGAKKTPLWQAPGVQLAKIISLDGP